MNTARPSATPLTTAAPIPEPRSGATAVAGGASPRNAAPKSQSPAGAKQHFVRRAQTRFRRAQTRAQSSRLLQLTALLALCLSLIPLLGQAPAKPAAPRFATIDLFLDSGPTPLAAWQIDFNAPDIKLVGIEGGDTGPYSQPAHYDPAALKDGGHIILAAFSTAEPTALPTGKARIARLHVMIAADAPPQPQHTLTIRVAADNNGQPIPAAAATAVTNEEHGDER